MLLYVDVVDFVWL